MSEQLKCPLSALGRKNCDCPAGQDGTLEEHYRVEKEISDGIETTGNQLETADQLTNLVARVCSRNQPK